MSHDILSFLKNQLNTHLASDPEEPSEDKVVFITEPMPRYELHFRPKRVQWIYCVVTDQPANGDPVFSIQNGKTSQSDETSKITFGPARLIDSEAAAADPVAAALTVRYPTLSCYRLVSHDLMIDCRQMAGKNLKLLLGDDSIVDVLPTPSPRRHSVLQHREARFHVITYRGDCT